MYFLSQVQTKIVETDFFVPFLVPVPAEKTGGNPAYNKLINLGIFVLLKINISPYF